MASRRLNERLARYNYLYDDDSSTTSKSSADATDSKATVDSNKADRIANGDSTLSSNNNNNMDSERVTSSRKNADSFSVSSDIDRTLTNHLPAGSARGPLLSSIATSTCLSSSNSSQSASVIRNVSGCYWCLC